MSVFSDIINSAHNFDQRAGAGAISVTAAVTFLATDSVDALTLADAQIGQLKYITCDTFVGVGTLTPTSPVGFSTIDFTAVGDWVILRWTGIGWKVANSRGVTVNA